MPEGVSKEKRTRQEVPLSSDDFKLKCLEGDLHQDDVFLAGMPGDCKSVAAVKAQYGVWAARKPTVPKDYSTIRGDEVKTYNDVMYNPKIADAVQKIVGDNPSALFESIEVVDQLFDFYTSIYDEHGISDQELQSIMDANTRASIVTLMKLNPINKDGVAGKYVYLHPIGNAGMDTSKVPWFKHFTQGTQRVPGRVCSDEDEAGEIITNSMLASFCKLKTGDNVAQKSQECMQALYVSWFLVTISLACAANTEQLGSKKDWKDARIALRKNPPQGFEHLNDKAGKITAPEDVDALHELTKQYLRKNLWDNIRGSCPFAVHPDVDAELGEEPAYSATFSRKLYSYYLGEKKVPQPDPDASYARRRLHQVSQDRYDCVHATTHTHTHPMHHSGLQLNPIYIFDASDKKPKNCRLISSRIARSSQVGLGAWFSTYLGAKNGVQLIVQDAMVVDGVVEPISDLESSKPIANPENGASMLLAASADASAGDKRARGGESDDEDVSAAKRIEMDAAAGGI